MVLAMVLVMLVKAGLERIGLLALFIDCMEVGIRPAIDGWQLLNASGI